MTRVGTARLTTGLVAAALAAGGAGVLPSPARADDGAPAAVQPPEVATVVPALDAGDALAAVEDELASAVDAADAALPAVEAPAESAPSPDDLADDTQAPDVDDADDPEATQTAETAETSGNQADTASDTTPATASPPPGTTQSSPANVNVSVRIGSPGDNGAVTQVNVAAALTSSGATTPIAAAGDSAQALPRADQTAQAAAGPSVVSPGGSSAISPTSETSTGEGAWTWQWDCMSAPSFSGLSPTGSSGGSIPANWTWIWNCGGNNDQYQSATAGQYHPINVNVSVRVGSPGDNGDVRQSNVAVAVSLGAGLGASAAVQSAGDSPDSPIPGIALTPLPTLVVVAPAAVLSPVAALVPEAAQGFAAVDDAFDLLVPWLEPSRSLPLPAVTVGSLVGGPTLRPASPTIGIHGELVEARPALGPTGLPVPALRAPTVETQAAAPQSRAAKSAKRASRWQAPTSTGSAPERAPSGTSVSAAGAAGSSSGSLPIFLALPFLAALLDLARRVALERIATPSEHRSRIPDTPG